MNDGKSVVVSGDLGSGKSTVSQLLAARLGLPRISMGDLHRQMAQERGMSALQLNRQAERDETIDDYIDQLQVQLAQSGKLLVVDSRLAWFFFKDAFKVHLVVDPTVGATRVISRPASEVESYSSISEAVKRLSDRSESERTRFIDKYKADKTRLRNYNIVCDSSRARPEEICDDIIAGLDGKFGNSATSDNSTLLDLDPLRVYPSRDDTSVQPPQESLLQIEDKVTWRRRLDPISVAYCKGYFYVTDGHRRLSAAVRRNLTLVPARLVAEADELVSTERSACEFFESAITPKAIHNWEVAHQIRLPPFTFQADNLPFAIREHDE